MDDIDSDKAAEEGEARRMHDLEAPHPAADRASYDANGSPVDELELPIAEPVPPRRGVVRRALEWYGALPVLGKVLLAAGFAGATGGGGWHWRHALRAAVRALGY